VQQVEPAWWRSHAALSHSVDRQFCFQAPSHAGKVDAGGGIGALAAASISPMSTPLIDDQGLAHPYPRAMMLRMDGWSAILFWLGNGTPKWGPVRSRES